MKRRSFMATILALFGLPVIAKIKSVEQEKPVLVDSVKISAPQECAINTFDENFTMEMWTSSCGEWQHITHVYNGDKVHIYADGFYVKTIDSYINAHGTIDKVLYNG